MGELTDRTNRAEGYAFLPVAWGFGATIGFVVELFYVMKRFFDLQGDSAIDWRLFISPA